jgi:hypothetical protein
MNLFQKKKDVLEKFQYKVKIVYSFKLYKWY